MTLLWSDGFVWRWTDMCPTGLTPFANNSTDLLPCFQELMLQMPIYTVFAALSAFHFGYYSGHVCRDRHQLAAIDLRAFISVLMGLLPIVKILLFYHSGSMVSAADILVVCTEGFMWIVHSGYLLSLRRNGPLNPRGPLLVTVIWLAIVTLDIIWLYSTRQFSWWPWSWATILLDFGYSLTLIPKGRAVPIVTQSANGVSTETTPLLVPRYTRFQFNVNEAHLGHAQDEATLKSRWLFQWVAPLISKGLAGNLKRIEDLFDLPECLCIHRLNERLQSRLMELGNLFKALHQVFGREFYLIGMLRFVADVTSFTGPLLLGGLLEQASAAALFTTEEKDSNWQPYIYALGLFGTQVINAFCSTHFNWRMSLIGMKMRVSVVSAIYRKALSAKGLNDTQPEVLNLMSTDTDRIVNSCISFHSFWSIPFQLFVSLYLLYTQVGIAFLAGVLFAIALIPFNRWLAQKISFYSGGLMTAKDARLGTTAETINGVKQIKLHAWEDLFIERIHRLRNVDMKFLSKRKYLDAVCVFFWATTPTLMCFLTIGMCVWLERPLTASRTYTSVALLNLLIAPLNAFPWVLNGLIEAWISIRRVQKLLDLKELDISKVYRRVSPTETIGHSQLFENSTGSTTTTTTTMVLKVKDATFQYDSSLLIGEPFQLKEIQLEVKEGELICIEGAVGSGKSSLLRALVAEMDCLNGSMYLHESCNGFGYVSQDPWLQRGTIRDNITWGNAYDEQWYKSVLHACALLDDLSELGGDLVGIGENGHTLSGGQRARVALARAVYQDKSIYLLDDVLASLDAHVSRHIIKHCILGLLGKKTRIVVTENTVLFYYANQILQMENGHLQPSRHMTDSLDLSIDMEELDRDDKKMTGRGDTLHLKDRIKLGDNLSTDSLNQEESREYGFLSWKVITTYWNAVSTLLAVMVLLSVILMQITRNITDAWLAHWVTITTTTNNNTNNNNNTLSITVKDTLSQDKDYGFYLTIYGILALVNSHFTLARAFLFAYAGLKAARVIHDRLLHRVIHTKFHFFDVTAVGRILNRFSSDVYTVDDSLPFIVNILLAQLIGLLGAIIVSMYAMPWLSLVVVPIIPIYLRYQQQYRHASRDIKRLSCNSLSPLYIHFTETLKGLTTIRSMQANSRFQRDFHVKLEESIKTQLTASAAQGWLGLRLQLLGAILVGGAGLLAAITEAHLIHPGFVGLAISYALVVTSMLGGVLNAIAESEQEMVAVERLQQYLSLESEEDDEMAKAILQSPPFGWPTQGVLQFHHVKLCYRKHLPPALHDVTFQTEAFEHLAIVGRTGAGKSSILAALMRVAIPIGGSITLDCMNVLNVNLRTLRDRIDIIPQDPFLFEGTVRENLDPKANHYDNEIWSAVTNSSTATTCLVQSLGGLEGRIERGGSNLSAGQKQLLCLVRALLKNSKVITIDEGTSNLDSSTEQAMHQVLHSSFKSSLVIFIAHSLRYLNHMDRVLVLDQGVIREIGPPRILAKDTNSHFHGMLLAQHVNIEQFCSEGGEKS